MVIKAVRVTGKDLEPGDLFSFASQLYWTDINLIGHESLGAIGQKVYIRTNLKTPEDQMNVRVYKIEIIK